MIGRDRSPSCLFVLRPELPRDVAWLGARERRILAGLAVAPRRSDWLLGRWAAKLLASELTGIGVGPELEILARDDGSPTLSVSGQPAEVALSLSHRRAAAFAAVWRGGEVGVDLEWIEERSPAFVEDYFDPQERQRIDRTDRGEVACLANGLWSAKESTLKLLRSGLSADTRTVSIEPLAGLPIAEAWSPWKARHTLGARSFQGWWRRRSGYVLTLVTDPPSSTPGEIHRRATGEGG